jgi:hypothetical protein
MKVIRPGKIDKVLPKEHIICSNCEAILEITQLEKLNHFQQVGDVWIDTGLKYIICVECGFQLFV